MNKTYFIVGASIIGFAGGAVGAYLALKDILEEEYSILASQEISEAKEFYSALSKKGDYETPADAVEKLIGPSQDQDIRADQAHREYLGLRDEEPDVQITNIFVNNEPLDRDSPEIVEKDPDRPYIITEKMFLENDVDYSQVSVTYFEEDDVLVDEKDQPIDAAEDLINSNNLRFGHLSNDINIVYVRNESKALDFEVARSRGSYSKEVLGFIEHSDRRPKMRKFRGDDD